MIAFIQRTMKRIHAAAEAKFSRAELAQKHREYRRALPVAKGMQNAQGDYPSGVLQGTMRLVT